MIPQIAVTSLLVGAAFATPYPPSLLKDAIHAVPDTVDFSPKAPGGGNYMPSHPSKHARASMTSPSVPEAAGNVERRQTNEKVSNGNVARYDSSNTQDGIGSGSDSYTQYLGNGSPSQGWPSMDRWVSFENMFNNYKDQMFQACQNQNPPQANDSGPEVGAIYDGIQSAAAASGVDHRFILAIMMQESHGCVRAPTTNYGVRNPGLMQDHNGDGTCNDNGSVQNPCPSATIYQMIREGAAGTNSGDGLANCINQSGQGNVADFYRAARIYNSGSVSQTGNLQSNIATHCYASDIANRLTGWVNAASQCNCDNNPSSCGVVTY